MEQSPPFRQIPVEFPTASFVQVFPVSKKAPHFGKKYLHLCKKVPHLFKSPGPPGAPWHTPMEHAPRALARGHCGAGLGISQKITKITKRWPKRTSPVLWPSPVPIFVPNSRFFARFLVCGVRKISVRIFFGTLGVFEQTRQRWTVTFGQNTSI